MSMAVAYPGGVAAFEHERTADRLSSIIASGLVVACVFGLDASYRVREMSSSLDWQVAMRLAICGLCGLFGVVNLQHTFRYFWRSPALWISVLLIWFAVTIPLSLDPRMGLAAVGTNACLLLFAPAALDRLGGRRFVVRMLGSLLGILLACWIAHFFIPSLGRRAFLDEDAYSAHRLGGLSHPNLTARLAVLALGLLMCLQAARQIRGRRIAVAVAFVFLGLTLLLTAGRTAALSCLVIVPFLVLPRRVFLYAALIGATAVAAVTILFASGAANWDKFVATYVSRSGSSQTVYKLQGRTQLWASVLDYVEQSPIIGTGFGSERAATLDTRHWSVGKHSHNLWLNTLLGGGVFGVVFLTIGIAVLVWQALADPDPVPDFILLFLLIHGLTSSPVLNHLPGSPTLLFFVALFWRPMRMSLRGRNEHGARTGR